jgi:hypothetical protein
MSHHGDEPARREAEDARRSGRVIERLQRFLRRLIAALSSRPAAFLLAGVVTSLVIPAATKQWSDRTAELQLKNDLASTITNQVSATVSAGQVLVGNLLPAARLRTTACPGAGIYDYQTLAVKLPDCREAIHQEDAAEADLALRERTRWMQAVSQISAQIELYYGADTANRWQAYTASVTRYFRVGIEDDCDANRTRLRVLSRAYGSAIPPAWRHYFSIPTSYRGRSLVNSPGRVAKCWDLPSALYRDYVFVGQQIVSDETPLLRTIETRAATGYSHGVSGILGDAFPFIIIFGATAVVIGVVFVLAGSGGSQPRRDGDLP